MNDFLNFGQVLGEKLEGNKEYYRRIAQELKEDVLKHRIEAVGILIDLYAQAGIPIPLEVSDMAINWLDNRYCLEEKNWLKFIVGLYNSTTEE